MPKDLMLSIETRMRTPRIDIASIRRQQIIESAVAIIAEQGLQNLSLSLIEQRAGMSRGQLTYYFPQKEDILLAVFDRLLQLMYERFRDRDNNPCEQTTDYHAWNWIRYFFETSLLQSPANPEFHCLHYTFLSQIGHREDVRNRLDRLYDEWRSGMAQGIAKDIDPHETASPRIVASFVQALLHGLAMQLAANPNAFDRQEMLDFCLKLVGQSFRQPGDKNGSNGETPANGSHDVKPHAAVPKPRRVRSHSGKKVSYE